MNKPVVLITGASSGIGQVCADYMDESGCKVYRASRSLPASDMNDSASIHMDVTDADPVNACVQRIAEKEGRIDVVVNCAGYGLAASVEDTSIEEIKTQLETNFYGAIRVSQAVLPLMRQPFTFVTNRLTYPLA
ncbi:MAG: SDR family NAD(P)-dependent oxidoreductase [Acidobacteria bacterium]|nr:SDR family NAD(P)-dependent oxidoreductase [Acidobacteriota bacterium]